MKGISSRTDATAEELLERISDGRAFGMSRYRAKMKSTDWGGDAAGETEDRGLDSAARPGGISDGMMRWVGIIILNNSNNNRDGSERRVIFVYTDRTMRFFFKTGNAARAENRREPWNQPAAMISYSVDLKRNHYIYTGTGYAGGPVLYFFE